MAISVLFYLVFRIYVMIEDLRRDVTKVVRSMAIENIKKKTPQTSKFSKKRNK
ncbi:hypothetical protein HY024_03485 [Candidatus Curtissbacteria bacterium]|nr:hypothetical protein [Candidatus Curtissbacteria bacterium]